jgi:hypothetical protein
VNVRARVTPLVLTVAVLGLASRAVAGPVEWPGSWDVDGAQPRFVEETLPGQLTTTVLLPIEGADRRVELSGHETPDGGLELASQWVDGIGLVGFLEDVRLEQRHECALRATSERDGDLVIVHAALSVDGHEVRRETWRARSEVTLVGLEVGGRPLAGEYDPKRAGPLLLKVRVARGATTLRARIEVAPGHPSPCFYDGVGSTIRTLSLGRLDPGEHLVPWDGRDGSAARRLALAGPYRVVVEAASTTATPSSASAGDDGLGLPLPVRRPAATTQDGPSRSACVTVAAPRLELICSDWPANYGNVPRPRWSEGPSLDAAAAFLTRPQAGGPGLAFERTRVLSDSVVAARFMKDASCALLETHGGVDSVWFYAGDPSVPWGPGAPRDDGITGRYFSPGDLRDLHFAILLICDGAIEDPDGRSFASQLRDAGCDVAIGFRATVDVGESRRFRDVLLRLVSDGAPVEKAARDAVRVTFRQGNPQPTHFLFVKTGTRAPTDPEMDALIDQERATPADPKVNWGIKSLASSIVVERGPGIPADESMWPPRHGNAAN